MQQPSIGESTCRHEYIKIFQRRLKGLERRLVATRAYLPVGFKAPDVAHLGEGSFCFCSKCRTRLYPRRTAAEKAAARLALAAEKARAEELALAGGEELENQENSASVDVEELVIEAVDMQDIEAEGVKLSNDEDTSCDLLDQEY